MAYLDLENKNVTRKLLIGLHTFIPKESNVTTTGYVSSAKITMSFIVPETNAICIYSSTVEVS